MLLTIGEKPNLHPVLRTLIMIFQGKQLISAPPFPWKVELDICRTIQIGNNYGGAIHSCIAYWGSTKSRERISSYQDKKRSKTGIFRDFGSLLLTPLKIS